MNAPRGSEQTDRRPESDTGARFMGIMWCIRLVVAAAAFAALTSVQSRAAELGGFFEHTLYTQDGEPAEAYKPGVLLLLHGFKSAMPNHDYGVIYDTFADAYTVAGFNYDYVDVTANVREFDDLFARFLDGRKVTLIGTSLGGFWADYAANRFETAGAILVNPSVKPEDTMKRTLGEQYSKKRRAKFTVTQEAVTAYAKLDYAARGGVKRLILLSKDDEIVDHRVAVKAFANTPGTKVVVFETGGHNLELARPDVMAVIRNFIENTQAEKGN